ncbi:hypothetical protein R6Q57_018447 [Mikania cordata]
MSCNGCRVLRKGCNDNCVLRPCLDWIPTPEAQAHATLFLSKFLGRSDLFSFISAVPDGHQRTALFQSLLYEAAGRTVNPVNGAMGLLATGNWHVCDAAVQAVLAGGSPEIDDGNWVPEVDESSDGFQSRGAWGVMMVRNQIVANNSNVVPPVNAVIADGNDQNLAVILASDVACDAEEQKLLNLFI